MKILKGLLVSRKVVMKRTVEPFQEQALKIIAFMEDGQANKASIFKCCRVDLRRAKIAFVDCQELNKPYSKYFFKVYSELNKI